MPVDHSIYTAEVYYKYFEYISKNNLHSSKAKNKVVRAYARPDSDCCLVPLLDMYLQLLPSNFHYFYICILENLFL